MAAMIRPENRSATRTEATRIATARQPRQFPFWQFADASEDDLLFLERFTGHHQANLFLGYSAGFDYALDFAIAQDQDSVTQFQQHIEVFADEQHGHVFLFLFVDQGVDCV